MKKATIVVGVVAGLALLASAWVYRSVDHDANRVHEQDAESPVATAPAITPEPSAAPADHQGFLYGRLTTDDGATFEGWLRFGGSEEAFWGDYFNGYKVENPWAALAPPEVLKERRAIEVFGVTIAHLERPINLGRPFMIRFGDIARIEARGRDVRVTLKSGTVFRLDRLDASDFDDGVRVWDGRGGAVDLDSGVEDVFRRQIRTIELFPTGELGAVPYRLHGTVRTSRGGFTGFVQWDRRDCVSADQLDGRTAEGELSLRFDTIRSIARSSNDSSLVTLRDGRELVLSGTREVGRGNSGIYVTDPRYGRVLISWEAFESVDFTPAGSGPAYGDFPAGSPLTGTVTTRNGRRLVGRLVYDLDESETTETLDAPFQGVDYTIHFGLIASIEVSGSDGRNAERAKVILRSGEELPLERNGDLGERNAGMLVFVDGVERPEYLPWSDVMRIDLDRPPATSTP